MRVIPPKVHRVLDFLTAISFALAPTVLHLSGSAATLAYLLAATHLIVTLLTAFAEEAPGAVPLVAHGYVELGVGLLLATLPPLVGWQGAARVFYLVAGTVILVVWMLSRYEPEGGDPAL